MIPLDTPHHPLLTALCREHDVRRYLEIGVQEGKSLQAALAAGTITSLSLIDPWGDTHGGTNRGSHAHIETLLKALHFTGIVTVYDQTSLMALPGLVARGRHWDLIHIDGDHTYAGALLDLAMSAAATHRMVLHDAHWPDVKLAAEVFLQSTQGWTGTLYPESLGTLVLERRTR